MSIHRLETGASLTATQVLRNSGKTIIGLLDQAQMARARAPETRAGVLRDLCMMIEIHAILEDEVFYPALKADLEVTSLVVNGRDDLASLRDQIKLLNSPMTLVSESEDRLAELTEMFAKHRETEEQTLFTRVEELQGPELLDLGKRVLRIRNSLLQEPGAITPASAPPIPIKDRTPESEHATASSSLRGTHEGSVRRPRSIRTRSRTPRVRNGA